MENTTEGSTIETPTISINYGISIEDRIWDLGIHLEDGIKIEELLELDKTLGDKKAFELERVNLNIGRLYPKRNRGTKGIINRQYEHGEKLDEGERGVTPTELFSLFKDGAFEDLRGVYISSPRTGEFIFLDLKDLNLQRHYTDDLPNYANAKFYAFPTIEIPKEK